jgi:hypothetical protein
MKYIFNPLSGQFDTVLNTASELANSPSGNLAATTVQAALNELQGDIDTINADIVDDVEGPASSTDNAIARFDGTTGKLLQNSQLIISDSGDLTGLGTITANSSGATNTVTLTHNGAGDAIQLNHAGAGEAIHVVAGNVKLDPLTASSVVVTDASKHLISSSVTSTTLGYLDATSSVQTQLNAKQATITGAATTIVSSNLTVSRAVVSDGSGKIAAATTTAAEIGFVNGVTSAIQTQIDGKQATITGGATTITSSNLTISRALVSDASGKVTAATTTSTEIGYVNGVTSAIQTQLNAKEPTITTLSIAKGGTNSGTTLNNNRVMQSAGSAIVEAAAITASRALISNANGIPTHSTVTSATLAFLDATSSVQTQLNARQTSLRSVIAVSTNVTLTTNAIHTVNTSSVRSLTLPSPVSGTQITVKDVTGTANVNNITIVRFASEQIEGVSASYTMDQTYQSITLIADGTNWWLI